MAKLHPVFSSFSSGEITPRLLTRSDVDAYKNGCFELTNFFASSHGPVMRRYGMEHITHQTEEGVANSGAIVDGRIMDFSISKSFGTFVYILLLEDGTTKIAPYSPNGNIVPPTHELVTNSSFEDGSAGWTNISVGSGSALFHSGSVDLVSGNQNGSIGGISQEITGTVAGNNTRLRMVGKTNPDLYPLRITIGTADGLADVLDETIVGQDIDVIFDALGTSIFFQTWVDSKNMDRGINQISIVDETVNLPIDGDVIFDAPWGIQDIEYIQYDSPPEGDAIYITSPYTPPHKLSYDEDTRSWTFEIVSFTGEPTEWEAGNYPKAITFFQGRMWLGGTPKQSETFWASKSADIENFTQGANADDGLEFTLSEQGEIEWVTGAKNLIIGTANGEHIVESSGGIIIPSDIQITQQSAYGSHSIQAEKIGQKVMYTSPDGRKIREIGYQWTDDGWISRDISFTSEHITLDNSIKQMAFAQNPDNLLWCVTNEGNAVCCTYEKTYEVIGWHRHNTAGRFVDVASFDLNGTSITGFLSFRNINGNNRMFVEVIDPYNTFRCDSWIHQYYENSTVEVSGLEHLAGNIVDVLTDSGVHPPIQINDQGVGYLQWEAKDVVCGHNFVSTLRTLPVDYSDVTGKSMAYEKRWNKIMVRILSSAMPLVNGIRGPERYPSTPMNEYQPFISNDIEVTNLGWDNWASIRVEQDLPVTLTISGVFGDLNREKL